MDLIQRVCQVAIEFLLGYSFQLLGAVLAIIAGFLVGRRISSLLLKVQEKSNVDVTVRQFTASTVRLLVLVMFVIVALKRLGVAITPLVAAIGGLAVGLSLALQGPSPITALAWPSFFRACLSSVTPSPRKAVRGKSKRPSWLRPNLRAEDGEIIVIPTSTSLARLLRTRQPIALRKALSGTPTTPTPCKPSPRSATCWLPTRMSSPSRPQN